LRPSEADRERVFEALRSRLGDAAILGGPASAPLVSKATRSLWTSISAATVGLGVCGGILFFALRPATHAAAQLGPAASASAPVARNAPAPTELNAASAPSAPVEPPSTSLEATTAPESSAGEPSHALAFKRVEPTAGSAHGSSGGLAQEVAILSRATSALHAGRPLDALKALDEHQRRFPSGALVEERRAARAQALCELGRRNEAEVELGRLAQSAPQSPQAARARQLCQGGR
jgi:TolA-binding protein